MSRRREHGGKYATGHATGHIHQNVTRTITTTYTTPVTSDKVKVISSTVTTNAVITTSSDVITTLTTTNAEGEPTTEVVTTETPVMVTTPVTTVVEITTTEPVTTDEVVTTTITVVQDPVDDDDSRIPPEPGPGRDPEPEDPTCPRPTCKLGVEMALYDNPFVNDFTSTYESFSPLYFKTAPPIETSVTRDPIFISDDDTGSGFDPTLRNAAAGYRGFMFACQDGTYTFESTYSDDITIMWFGEKAYAGYTRENADIIQFYYGDNELKTVTREIKAGTYYPIRVLWGNTNGASDLSLHIYAPDGRELSGVDEGHEDYLTTQACDGSYPPYAPWGAEP